MISNYWISLAFQFYFAVCKNDLESSSVNTNNFSSFDNSHNKDSLGVQCRIMVYVSFNRMAVAMLF